MVKNSTKMSVNISLLIHKLIQGDSPHWLVSMQTTGTKARQIQAWQVNSLHDPKKSHAERRSRLMKIRGPEI